MAKIGLEQVVHVISRPPHMRSDADINACVPWLRKRTELMTQLHKGEILCSVNRSMPHPIPLPRNPISAPAADLQFNPSFKSKEVVFYSLFCSVC